MEISLYEEPETSWSENTTPASDDLGEIDESEEIEEIEPTPLTPIRRSGDLGSNHPRFMRSPIRRRARPNLYHAPGVTKCQQSYTFPLLDSRISMDSSEGSASSTLTITSATSSCTSADLWSSAAFVEEVDGPWERDDEDLLLVPKVEPADEDIIMADVKEKEEQPATTGSDTATPTVTVKRPRGRPRKHPKINPEDKAKIAKARSKTGCITCRKRKKKCDERKPGCMNCEKNAVTCEGYPQKTLWRSGKERAEEAQRRRASLSAFVPPPLASLIPGVERHKGDKIFLDHYVLRLSSLFTVEGAQNNAFVKLLLPMALQHEGVMHSILALSGKHLDFRSPAGLRYVQDAQKENPDMELDIRSLEERSEYHHDQAVLELNSSVEQQKSTQDKLVPTILAQMLCLILETLADPSPTGQHRVHLQIYETMVKEWPPEDTPFSKFVHEFFQYHKSLDELISLPRPDMMMEAPQLEFVSISDEWVVPSALVQPAAVRLLGVFDGLFFYMSKITHLRNTIRERMRMGNEMPVVDYTILDPALNFHAGIERWKPSWPEDDSRSVAGELYRRMLYVYLWRTIYPPTASNWYVNAKIIETVDQGIELLEKFGPRDPSQTLILAPAFVLGCAAFKESQRESIRRAIAAVKAYMEYKNSDTALLVLEKVWRLMDARDPRSWDWQTIAHDMGMDFLAT